MLLLGVTAISLLTTPIVFAAAHGILPRETAAFLPIVKPTCNHRGPMSIRPSDGDNESSQWRGSQGARGRGTSGRAAGASVLRTSRASGAAECAHHSQECMVPPWVCVTSEAEAEERDSRHGQASVADRRTPHDTVPGVCASQSESAAQTGRRSQINLSCAVDESENACEGSAWRVGGRGARRAIGHSDIDLRDLG
jgi:hypothetical protein